MECLFKPAGVETVIINTKAERLWDWRKPYWDRVADQRVAR
jgi:hypothetical protein